jgi:hypothetical protein
MLCRIHDRISFDVKARLVRDAHTYHGYIKNVSVSGIGYLITSTIRINYEIDSTEVLRVNFEIPTGETVDLNCEVVWTERGLFSGKTVSLGMRIIDPPPDYGAWIKKLFMKKTERSSRTS